MVEIQQCPVCHIFIHLDKKGRILNPYSDNYPEADESLIRYIQNEDARVLPPAPQRTERYHTALRDIRLDKKNYILAKGNYVIYPKKQCLYYWFGTRRVVACAVHDGLRDPLLIPFRQKQGQWRHLFKLTRKVVSWDGVSNFDDWLADSSETAYAENATLNGMYEVILENGVFTGYNEVNFKKTGIQYTNNDDVSKKMKNDLVAFEFLYNYDKNINDPCCMVGFQRDPKLGVAMIVLIY
jgi:hypothetical protein